jgi:hypothetical protein
VGQPLDDLGTPALRGLSRQNVAANLSIKQHQLTVDRERCTLWMRYFSLATRLPAPTPGRTELFVVERTQPVGNGQLNKFHWKE